MTASMDSVIFWCCHFRRQQWVYYVTASWVPYHIHTAWYDHPPCAESRLSPHKKDLTRPPAVVTAKKKMKKKNEKSTYTG